MKTITYRSQRVTNGFQKYIAIVRNGGSESPLIYYIFFFHLKSTEIKFIKHLKYHS